MAFNLGLLTTLLAEMQKVSAEIEELTRKKQQLERQLEQAVGRKGGSVSPPVVAGPRPIEARIEDSMLARLRRAVMALPFGTEISSKQLLDLVDIEKDAPLSDVEKLHKASTLRGYVRLLRNNGWLTSIAHGRYKVTPPVVDNGT